MFIDSWCPWPMVVGYFAWVVLPNLSRAGWQLQPGVLSVSSWGPNHRYAALRLFKSTGYVLFSLCWRVVVFLLTYLLTYCCLNVRVLLCFCLSTALRSVVMSDFLQHCFVNGYPGLLVTLDRCGIWDTIGHQIVNISTYINWEHSIQHDILTAHLKFGKWKITIGCKLLLQDFLITNEPWAKIRVTGGAQRPELARCSEGIVVLYLDHKPHPWTIVLIHILEHLPGEGF